MPAVRLTQRRVDALKLRCNQGSRRTGENARATIHGILVVYLAIVVNLFSSLSG